MPSYYIMDLGMGVGNSGGQASKAESIILASTRFSAPTRGSCTRLEGVHLVQAAGAGAAPIDSGLCIVLSSS
jgi:hypothetical protein